MSLDGEKIQCPHCRLNIRYSEEDYNTWYNDENEDSRKEEIDGRRTTINSSYGVSYGQCPACDCLIVYYVEGETYDVVSPAHTYHRWSVKNLIFPRSHIKIVETEVPERFKKDFLEAMEVLPISPKASAALSRRILQDIFREELKIKKSSLAKEIDDFILRTDIPSYLTDAVDAVRNIGNFAAHPLKDTNTGAIIEVEPGEAEWLLEVNESLFDFVFVQPKRLAERKDKLNQKLQALGKPKMKK